MKKILLAAAASLALNAHAAELKQFGEIANAVDNGKQLTIVIKLKQCEADIPVMDISTAVTPNAMMRVGDKMITASDRHFSLNDPMANGLPTFGYVKYTLLADSRASVKVTLMHATDYSKIAEYEIRCQLGEGLSVFDNQK
ncbi:VirK family protein [Legionella dresdenensis]|uniref:VirK family protein n=1 Tax=Legionella dresdenensis TaxID=450200 RepID=A0ABV8CED2_9GAMM